MLTLKVNSTRPIKYSHRGQAILDIDAHQTVTVELVCQIDPVHQLILDCRWAAAINDRPVIDAVDATLMAWIGQSVDIILSQYRRVILEPWMIRGGLG